MSNKTLNERTEKTASARRSALLTLCGVALLVVGVALWQPHGDVVQNKLKLEKVSSQQARDKGLSGRTGLSADSGMLFVFENEGEHCFWMKDMKFAIDMVWLDKDKKVVKVKENVSPDTYPETFCADVPAQYVIEVSAGVAQRAGIGVGKIYEF